MSLFSSPRERRLWLWTLAVVAAVYSTLGLAGTLAGALREYGLLDASTLGLFALFLLGATILTLGLRVRPSGIEIAVMFGVAFAYLLLILRSTYLPEERTHLMEYGVVGVFIHAALAERASQGRRVPLAPVVAVVLTAALGVVDEGIQWLLPNRVFDPVDMLFNLLAGATSVAAVVTLAWARRMTLRRRGQPKG
ncbi:MAG: VanZ family protein [Chloroflexota bacterium]|nr:VanZ family protein [Chloroflexota bacterium]